MSRDIFIVTGETSADMHAAALARELKNLDPQIKISGIGSSKMRAAGVEIIEDLSKYAIIGFLEAFKYLPKYKQTFNSILRYLAENRPQVLLLIDYPGFNLRLAKAVREKFPQIKIIYYISPQIWAWGKKRIHLIKKIVDKMIVVFEFEKDIYKAAGVDVEFVGHPLLEHLEAEKILIKDPGSRKKKISPSICLLPGSRKSEVQKLLPLMLKSALLLKKKQPQTQFTLIRADKIKKAFIEDILGNHPGLDIKVQEHNTYQTIANADFAWVCSGTATLETAVLGTPMIILYKTSWLTYLLSRLLIKLPHIGLANIVAGEGLVPELIQHRANEKNLVALTIDFISQDTRERDELRNKLLRVKTRLGNFPASKKAAEIIYKILANPSD